MREESVCHHCAIEIRVARLQLGACSLQFAVGLHFQFNRTQLLHKSRECDKQYTAVYTHSTDLNVYIALSAWQPVYFQSTLNVMQTQTL
jgi:hypothetical protein